MASSPFDTAPQAQPQSHPDGKNEIPLMRTVIVVPQEKLEGSKKKFERLSAIHVYSVESAPLSVSYLADIDGDVCGATRGIRRR